MATQQETTSFDEAGSAGGGGRAAAVIGVLGAGTMGNGIAQLAARSGAKTLLYDPFPDALEKGTDSARKGLAKEAAKGKLTDEQAQKAADSLSPVDDMAALADCELVIEAGPERLELKHEMYAKLSEVVSEQCVLATNTSSLLVTAIARGASHPERVGGMHFFNPAPLMRLLEVVAALQSSRRALALARATGEAMGKTVIVAKDGPGFIVNRCNRPFGLEALRLLQEQISDVQTIDRICRLEGGFRMGPFELMDLVGVDTGLEISESFYAQSYGEPRWRPSMIAARQVAAGLYGRKSGRGYYDYGDGAHRPQDPEPPTPGAPGQGEGVVVICGEGVVAQELRAAAGAAGYEVRTPPEPSGGVLPALFVHCDAKPGGKGARTSNDAGVPDRRGAHSHMHGGARLVLGASGALSALGLDGQ